MEERTRIGVGVVVFKEGKILLGKRIGKHLHGFYAGPGGHLDFRESFAECAKRETREEAGIEIGNLRFLALTNMTEQTQRHYVDIGLVADWISGDPVLKEPDKCAGWEWYALDALPQPLLPLISNYLAAYQGGAQYYDAE